MKTTIALVLLLFAAGGVQAESQAAKAQAPEAGEVAKSSQDDGKPAPRSTRHDPNCPSTASRIRSRRATSPCPFAGSVYSRGDLQKTGHADTASALRQLDPAFR